MTSQHSTRAERPPSPRRTARASEAQVGAWRALARAFAGASRVLEAALADTGLELSEYDVLVTIAQTDAGVRPTELADRVLLTKSGVTRLLDRLEGRGLLARRECPGDRRGHLVTLTPTGRRMLRRAAPALVRSLGAVMSALSGTELAELDRAAARVWEAARQVSPPSAERTGRSRSSDRAR